MSSDFKIDTTTTVVSLDALTVPCPDPQWEFRQYQEQVSLGNGSLRGMGLPVIVWTFPLIEDAQVAQLEAYKSTSHIYIQSKNRAGALAVYEVTMNWVDPRQDGDHMGGFRGFRSGLVIEFIVWGVVT